MGSWNAVRRGLKGLALLSGVFFMLLFCYVAVARMHYPFELEKMESGMATSVWRVANHQPLYLKPTMTWAPYLYAPVFFYVCAALTKLVGAGYVATRLVSTLSTVGVFAVIAGFVWLEARRWVPAIAAAGLYASLFSTLGAWFDIGRVDSLALLLLLLALLATRYLHPAVAALVWLAVFQTKQGYLPLAPVLFLFEWARPRRMIAGILTYIVAAAASVAWMQHVSGGWYNFYVFGTTTQLPIVWREVTLYLPNDVFAVVGIAVLIILAAALFRLGDTRTDVAMPGRSWQACLSIVRDRRASFYLVSSALMVLLIWFVRAHRGASENALLPMYAWIAVLFGLAIAALERRLESGAAFGGDGAFRTRASVLLWAAVVVQIGMHLYNPGRWIPSHDTLVARQRLLEEMRRAPGDVWALSHSWDNVLIGRPIHPERDAFDAVLVRKVSDRTREAHQELQKDWNAGHFAAVFLDDPAESYPPQFGFTGAPFDAHYGLRMRAAGEDSSDAQNQPREVRLPCNAEQIPGDPDGTRNAYLNRELCR